MEKQKQSLRTHVSIILGNLFEHYDNALFGFLSPFLAPLIFPKSDPLTALILTYAMIPLGMIARPLGAFVFGMIGDTYGRKQALFLSMAGMSFISLLMALSPTYEQVGLISPLIFCIARILQNVLAAGETMGGAILLLEKSDEKKHDLLSSIYGASTIGGILLASLGISALCYFQFMKEGWRLLYLFGSITCIFGSFIRVKLHESNFVGPKVLTTFASTIKTLFTYKKELLVLVITSGFSYACYSISLVFANGFIPYVTSMTKEEMASLNTFLLIVDFMSLPLFGLLATKVTRERLMLFVAVVTTASALPSFILLEGADPFVVITFRTLFVLLGVAFSAPFHAFAQSLIPQDSRYVVISFGYALGSQLLGGPTAAISLWLFKSTEIASSAALYWTALGLFSAIALLKVRKQEVLEPVK